MIFFQDALFTDHVAALMLEHRVPGIAVAVVSGDAPAMARGFGYASIESNEPCTPDTLFDVASCAKSLTAAAVALLVEDNRDYPHLQYDTPVSSLLPDDFIMSRVQHTQGATVEDVLGHRTGMAGHDDSYMGLGAAEPDTARSITRNLRNLQVAAPLRSRYLYCNMMYTVATHLVEVESKQTFSEFLETRLFEPLAMTSTSLQPARSIERGFRDRLAKGHIWDKHSKTYRELDCRNCPEGQGAGSVISSVNDFIKWVRALLQHTFPITKAVYEGLTKMRSIVNPNGRRLKPHTSPAIYAAGMEVYYYRGQKVVGHDGNIAGFAGRFVILPDLQLGIVVMGNSSGAGGVCSAIIRALMDNALNIPVSELNLRKPKKSRKVSAAFGAKSVINRTEELVARADCSNNMIANQSKSVVAAQPKIQSSGQRKNSNNSKSITRPPQEVALSAYIGVYNNTGYRTITVTIREQLLYVDATDRSMGFTLTFEHCKDQRKYIAHLCDLFEGGSDPVDAEFILRDGRAVRLGLDLEPAVRDLIWFDLLTKTIST